MIKKKASNDPVHRTPSDLSHVLNSDSKASSAWKDITSLARNEWICWVISAVKPETRKKRIERTLNELKTGKRRPCCWAGCVHR